MKPKMTSSNASAELFYIQVKKFWIIHLNVRKCNTKDCLNSLPQWLVWWSKKEKYPLTKKSRRCKQYFSYVQIVDIIKSVEEAKLKKIKEKILIWLTHGRFKILMLHFSLHMLKLMHHKILIISWVKLKDRELKHITKLSNRKLKKELVNSVKDKSLLKKRKMVTKPFYNPVIVSIRFILTVWGKLQLRLYQKINQFIAQNARHRSKLMNLTSIWIKKIKLKFKNLNNCKLLSWIQILLVVHVEI